MPAGDGKQRRKIRVDGGYAGQPVAWGAERTFGGLNRSSRLSKCCERLTDTNERWIYLAMNPPEAGA